MGGDNRSGKSGMGCGRANRRGNGRTASERYRVTAAHEAVLLSVEIVEEVGGFAYMASHCRARELGFWGRRLRAGQRGGRLRRGQHDSLREGLGGGVLILCWARLWEWGRRRLGPPLWVAAVDKDWRWGLAWSRDGSREASRGALGRRRVAEIRWWRLGLGVMRHEICRQGRRARLRLSVGGSRAGWLHLPRHAGVRDYLEPNC